MKITSNELPLLANALTELLEFDNNMVLVYRTESVVETLHINNINQLIDIIDITQGIVSAIFAYKDHDTEAITVVNTIPCILAYVYTFNKSLH